MCGIVGWIQNESNIYSQAKIVEEMMETLSNRGPDEYGLKAYPHALLGHRRLTVIDPEGGHQPMTIKRGNQEYTIVYNGELYNTEEVRQKLIAKGHTFQAYSDTEVLLTAYIEWKEACLDHINGIYAFGIWDETEQSLFLVRDPLGVKPLFYGLKNKALLFASEIKALLKHPMVRPIVEEEGLMDIFALGPARSLGMGIFKDVDEVPPGHYVLFKDGKPKLVEYWKLIAKPHEEDLETTIEHTQSLLVDAIERQLVSDVPICTFLSGGLDSSAISTVASNYFKKNGKDILNTFSIDYEDNEKHFKKNVFQPNSDSDWVDKMSDFIGSKHHKIILNNEDLVKALREAVLANDLPGMADIDSSLYLFCKEVRKQATVALSGECADEIFGGYPWFTDEKVQYSGTFPWSQSVDLRKRLIGKQFKKLPLEDYVRSHYQETINQVSKLFDDSKEDAKMREMFYLNIKWFMITLLNRKDRMSMANSLEVRVPFADHRLVEYAYNIPKEMKLLNGREKGLLRESLRGILPDGVIDRKKSPYPKTHHPIYTQLVTKEMTDILNDPQSPILQIIDKQNVQSIVKSQGKKITQPLYGQLMTGPQVIAYLIQINTWLKEYQVEINL